MEWCDSRVESVDMLMKEAEEKPRLWEDGLCYWGRALVQPAGRGYSACPYFHLLPFHFFLSCLEARALSFTVEKGKPQYCPKPLWLLVP